jgi:hypothetical protein
MDREHCKHTHRCSGDPQLTSRFSVCLFVYSLLAETPKDMVFYWKQAQDRPYTTLTANAKTTGCAHEPHFHTNDHLECPGWRYRQPHHLAPSGCTLFVEDTHDNFGVVPSKRTSYLLKRRY